MKYAFFLLIIISSCSSNDQENTTDNKDNSYIGKCLKYHFDDYFENFELIKKVLSSDGLLTDDKDGFSETIRIIYSPEIGDFNLTDSEWEKLNFVDELSHIALLLSCCEGYIKEKNLTIKQTSFFKEFHSSLRTGGIDTQKIAEILDSMSIEEFESEYVKETALIFIAHELIRNHYIWHMESVVEN